MERSPYTVRKKIVSLTPESIRDIKGGPERACCLIIVVQLILLALYVCTSNFITTWLLLFLLKKYLYVLAVADFFKTGLFRCGRLRYLSLRKTQGLCTEIMVPLNGDHFLDDNGFFDTNSDWSFTKTMLSAQFIEFEISTDKWPGYSRNLYAEFEAMNNAWATKPSVHNLLSMVVAQKAVQGDQLLIAHVVADPKLDHFSRPLI